MRNAYQKYLNSRRVKMLRYYTLARQADTRGSRTAESWYRLAAQAAADYAAVSKRLHK